MIKMEQMEAVDNMLVKMEAEESDQDDYTKLCKNTIVSCEDDEDDSDDGWIISSDDDTNLLRRPAYVNHRWRIANGQAMAAKWSEYVKRSMIRFLRYGAFEQDLLTENGWILLKELLRHLQLGVCGERTPTWKANLDPSMISTNDVLHEVRQNGKAGKPPYFELFMSGSQVWLRATPGLWMHTRRS